MLSALLCVEQLVVLELAIVINNTIKSEKNMRVTSGTSHRLQSRVLQALTHQQQLIPLAKYPEKFQDEYAHLLKHEAEIQPIWAELKAFVAKSPTLQAGVRQATIIDLLQTYEGIPQLYSQELERRVERIRSLISRHPLMLSNAKR